MLASSPMCARTGREWWWPGHPAPCLELATQDDHIRPIVDGGDLDDPANRQGLCEGCHVAKTKAEAAARH